MKTNNIMNINQFEKLRIRDMLKIGKQFGFKKE